MGNKREKEVCGEKLQDTYAVREVRGEKLQDTNGGSYSWTDKMGKVGKNVTGCYQRGESSKVNFLTHGKEKGSYAGGGDLIQKTVDIYLHEGKKIEHKNVSKGTGKSFELITGLNNHAEENNFRSVVEHQLQYEGGTQELKVTELKCEEEHRDVAHSKHTEEDSITISALKRGESCKTSAGSTWKRRARVTEGVKAINPPSTKRKVESLAQMDPEGDIIENGKRSKMNLAKKKQTTAAKTDL